MRAHEPGRKDALISVLHAAEDLHAVVLPLLGALEKRGLYTTGSGSHDEHVRLLTRWQLAVGADVRGLVQDELVECGFWLQVVALVVSPRVLELGLTRSDLEFVGRWAATPGPAPVVMLWHDVDPAAAASIAPSLARSPGVSLAGSPVDAAEALARIVDHCVEEAAAGRDVLPATTARPRASWTRAWETVRGWFDSGGDRGLAPEPAGPYPKHLARGWAFNARGEEYLVQRERVTATVMATSGALSHADASRRKRALRDIRRDWSSVSGGEARLVVERVVRCVAEGPADVRRVALWALWHRQLDERTVGEDTFHALRREASRWVEDPDPLTRWIAQWTVGSAAEGHAVPVAVVERMFARPEPALRWEAIGFAARGWWEREARPMFLAALEDPDPDLRAAAAMQVGRQWTSAVPLPGSDPLPAEYAVLLVRMLREEDARLRALAAWALSSMIAPESAGDVHAGLKTALRDPELRVRREAARALLRHEPTADLMTVLAEDLAHPEPLLRERAIDALHMLGAAASPIVPRILELVADPCPEVSGRARRAMMLWRPEGDAALAKLVELVGNPRLSVWAIKQLGRAGEPARPVLTRLTSHSDAELRQTAEKALKSARKPR